MTATKLSLRPYQREAIDAVAAAWAEGILRPAIVLATGLGKSQPVDEPVLTPLGWRKMGELAVGDHVIGRSGSPALVTGVFPQGVRPTVRVRFTDQTEVRCDPDHLWDVQTRSMKSDAKRRGSAPWRTMTTDEIAHQIKAKPSDPWFVPVVSPVEYEAAGPLPVDPYTLGVLLGDGGLSIKGQVRVHTRHDIIPLLDLPDGHRAVLYQDQGVMGNYRISSGGGCSANRVLNALRELGLQGHMAHGKFIPEKYIRASPADRLALLQGLLDTDGSPIGAGADYVSVSQELAEGVAELVRSLGGRCRISEKSTSWTYLGEKKHGHAYRAYITLPRNMKPFRVARKADKLSVQQFDPVKRIESIVPGLDSECVCISVDALDQLYVTAGYAVTHNTVIFSQLASEYREKTGKRVLILVHRDELADQAMAKVRGIAPHLSVGKVKATDNDTGADVVVASVQTASRSGRLAYLTSAQNDSGPIGLVITDECHHSVSPSYQKIYAAFPSAVQLGVTATLARGDGVGLGSVVDEVVYEKSIAWGIRKKFLSPVRGVAVRTPELDLSAVRSSRGDYQVNDLGAALESSGVLDVIPKAYTEHAADRPGVVFLPTVATAHHTADSLNAAGIRTAVISGETTREDRIRIFEDYRTGRVQVLSNCMVLTEGFDAPHTSCIVVARPTQSNPLYVQMVGRGTRPFPGKTDCLVLDVVGAGATNKLRTLVDLEPGMFPDPKLCDECGRVPCVCPCASCGGPRPCPECNGGTELELVHGKTEEVDLFAGSSQSWLMTRGGVMFIPAGESDVLLWPSRTAGLWDVVCAPKSGKWSRLHEALPLGTAQAWAETEADELAPFNVRKTASWRRKKPSEKQLLFARQLGVQLPADVRSGDLGNLISVALASRKLDRYLPRV